MTVEIPALQRPAKHYAISIYLAGTSPKNGSPVWVSLCPGARATSDPLASRWQAVTCRQCIAFRKALGL